MTRHQEQDERAAAERRAWTIYTDATRDLTGRDYDEAEAASWARLQRDLAEVAGRFPDRPARSVA